MGIEYKLRMSGILSFRDKTDDLSVKIKDLFIKQKALLNENKIPTEYYVLKLTMEELKTNSFISKFYSDRIDSREYEFVLIDSFEDFLAIEITDIDNDVYKVDFCIGNKNRDDRIELFLLLLTNYMNPYFEVVYYDETKLSRFNHIKSTLDDYVVNEYNYPCIFDILNTVDYVVADDIENEDEEWLYSGLKTITNKVEVK